MNIDRDRKFLEHWMYYSYPRIKDTPLVTLAIPGTHNSNTYTFNSFINPIVKNQKWTVLEQLRAGVRYLDMRYGHNGSIFIDKHGPCNGTHNFLNHFKDVKEFLKFSPLELVIIKIQAE